MPRCAESVKPSVCRSLRCISMGRQLALETKAWICIMICGWKILKVKHSKAILAQEQLQRSNSAQARNVKAYDECMMIICDNYHGNMRVYWNIRRDSFSMLFLTIRLYSVYLCQVLLPFSCLGVFWWGLCVHCVPILGAQNCFAPCNRHGKTSQLNINIYIY